MTINPVKIKNYIDLIPKDFARSVAFSSNGKFLAAGTEKDGVLIYNVKDWKIVVKLPHSYSVDSVEWSPDSMFMASGSISGSVKIWDSENWDEVHTLEESIGAVNLSWSANRNYLIAGSLDRSDKKPFLDIWQTKDWKKLDSKVYRSRNIALNSSSSLFAINYNIKEVRVFSLPNINHIASLDFSDSDKHVSLGGISWHPDGTVLCSSCCDGRIRIWQSIDWSVVITKQLHEYWDEGEYNVSFSPNGKYLLSGGFGEPKLLSTKTWEVIFDFPKGTLADLFDVSWSPDSKYLALVLENGKEIEIWNIESN